MKTKIKKEYYKNGKLSSETPFKNDLIHGIKKEYYQNGNLWSEIPYKNNRKHGISKDYHLNKNINILHFYNDVVFGLVIC